MKRLGATLNRSLAGRASLLGAVCCVVAGCASGPTPPDWQADALQALQDAQAAYLKGDTAGEARQFERARSEIARTGRLALMARAELMRCAAHAASLVFEPCAGYEALQADAAPPERAYAAHLAGHATAQDLALLPEAQRAVAAASANPETALAALKAQADPLSRLVAAALLFQAGRASPATVQLAVDTASEQGWRRPLLAWLSVQRERAEKSGDVAEAARLRRRIDFVLGPAGKPVP
jgi:hypothetical protein